MVEAVSMSAVGPLANEVRRCLFGCVAEVWTEAAEQIGFSGIQANKMVEQARIEVCVVRTVL